jgi:zinc transporter 1/2/3
MSLINYKIIAALIIFIVTFLAVLYPVWAKKRADSHHLHLLDFGDAFASGVFLGVALFHMLPEASSVLGKLFPTITYPLAGLFCAGGFLILLFLERLSESTNKNYQTIPYVLAIIIIIHSAIEGAVLGINAEVSTLSILFLAILAHKGSESFALSVALHQSKLSFVPMVILVGIFSLTTPISIALGTFITSGAPAHENQLLTAGFNAFAAGTFLYMSTLHHINHHQRLHEAESLLEFICLFAGVALMALIAALT